MNTTKPKKLSLNRETIRNLSEENLEQVAGGGKKNGGGGGNQSFIGAVGLCIQSVSLQLLNGHVNRCC